MEMIELDELPGNGEEGDALFTLDIFAGKPDEVLVDARGNIAHDENAQRMVVAILRAVAKDIEERFSHDDGLSGV